MTALQRAALLTSSVVVLVACGASSPKQPGTATAHPTSTPAASAVGAGPTIGPTGCRLPIGNRGTSGSGGFVNLPAGTFTPDPHSRLTYDWALSKWLPVPRTWVSPDGLRYAYPEYATDGGPASSTMHIVDVVTGADRALRLPAPSAPISFANEGLYVGRVIPNSDSPPVGLALLNPESGRLRQIVSTGSWTLIEPPVAWGVDLDPSIDPPRWEGLGGGNRLRQLQLGSGDVVAALTMAGTNIELIGFDGRGAPVLGLTAGSSYRVGAFSAFSGLDEWFSGATADDNPGGPMVGAGSEAWLSSGSDAIWQKSAGSPLRKIATPPLQHPGVGGACK